MCELLAATEPGEFLTRVFDRVINVTIEHSLSSSGALLLGIDVGTTTVKASVVELGAGVLGQASAPYPTDYVRPSWVEQDPEHWWRATVEVLGLLAAQLGTAALARVAGIAVSSQAPALVPLDSVGQVVRPALIWMDRRAEREAQELAEIVGRDRYPRRSGNRADPFYVAPKLRWFASHEPEAFARTATFVQVNGYIAYRLTGVLSLDEQHASILGLRDNVSNVWSPELLAAASVDEGRFPPIRRATDVVGSVVASVAGETGLRAGTPVAAGTVDSAAAALEAGVVSVGQAAEMTGTSTVLTMPVREASVVPEFISMASVLPGQWLELAAMVSTGASLNWLKNLVAPQREFSELTESAAAIPPGGEGLLFLPYMMGERSPLWSSEARGMFLGLTLGSGVAELTRAVLEGTAFALRHNLEVAAVAGTVPLSLRSIGGPSASDAWSQIKADATGIPIERMRAPTGATFGGAMIAAAATGLVPELAVAVSEAATVEREFVPDPRKQSRYDELFALYRSSYEHVKPELEALAAFSSAEQPK